MSATLNRLFDRAMAPVERIVAALADPARRNSTLLMLLAAYVAVWTLYGVIAKGSEDIHADMAEIVMWSRELALGYPKHPPLAAWLVAGWFAVFPVTDWAFYLLAMTVAALALWIAWQAAGDYLGGEKRVLTLALLTLVPFFNFHALKFNVNTILLPLWGATALCFLRSFERRAANWAALAGLCAAGAMLAKYWSIFLLAGLGIAALLDSRRAGYFRSMAPWITIAVGAVAIAPHVVWLAAHDFAPFTYGVYVHTGESGGSIGNAGAYLLGSEAYVALPMLLAFAVTRPGGAALRDVIWPAAPERRLVAMAFWAPLLLPALIAPLAGIGIMSLWSMSAWTLLPAVLLSTPLLTLHRRAMLSVVALALVLPPLAVAAAPLVAGMVHRHERNPAAQQSRLLADRVAHEWRRVTGKPLRMVGGNRAPEVAFYLPGRVSAFPDLRQGLAPWADPARLARDGIAVICIEGNADCRARAQSLGPAGPVVSVEIARIYRGIAGQPERYDIMIVAPRSLGATMEVPR